MLTFLRNHAAYAVATFSMYAVACTALIYLSLFPIAHANGISSVSSRLALDENWHTGAYSAQGVTFSQQPSWVKTVAVIEPEVEPIEELADGIFHLLLDNQYRVAENGEQSGFDRYAIKVTSAKGLDHVSQITVSFDPSYERISFHGVKVIRDGIEIDKTFDGQFSLDKTDNANDLLYDGSLTAFWAVNDIRIGDIVEYSFTRYGQNPVYGNTFTGGRTLQWQVPIQQQFIRVLWGKSNPLYFKMHNTEQTFTETRLGHETDYQLLVTQQPTLAVANDAAAWYEPFAKARFSESKDWQSVVDWALPMFERQIDESAALQDKLIDITQQSSELEQQVMLALNFVQQDIRYLGIEIGSNSHFPAKASDTLAKRYGDCKDKSVLLIALLKGLGVEASPVLVNSQTGEELIDRLASAKSFNHAIVKAKINEKSYWFDPTLQYQQVSLDAMYQPNYGYALVVEPGVDALEKMPDERSGSKIEFAETYDFREGVAKPSLFTSTVTYSGYQARRKRVAIVDSGVQALSEQYAKYYDKIFNGLTVNSPLEVTKDKAKGTLTISEDYLLSAPWTEGDENDFTIYLYETQLSPYLTIPESLSKRTLPLSYPLQIEGDIVVKLRDSNWSFSDETIEEDNPFFKLVYQVAYDKSQRQLSLSYAYQSKVDRVEVGQLSGYISALKKVSSIDSYGIVDYPNATVAPASASESTATSDTPEPVSPWVILVILILLGFIYAFVNLMLEAKSPHQTQFYPVSTLKFFVLSVFSLGLYSSYWSYKNWQYIKHANDRPDIWPVARGLFAPLWYYPLYSWLNVHRDQQQKRSFLIPAWSAVILFAGYLFWNGMSWELSLGYWDDLIPFIVFAPLVIYINKVNSTSSEAYVANSQWHARNWVFIACMAPLLIFTLAQDVGLTAQDKIIKGEELWSHHIDFMQQNKVLAANETPLLFYSSDWIDNQADGNGFTQQTVFSYWVEDDELQVVTSLLKNVKDIQVDYAEPNEDIDITEVTVHIDDGEEFILYATTTEEQDKVFVDRLMLEWHNQREVETLNSADRQATEKH
ncbi:DUF3857 domain-containing protein [Shewanella sp. KX20019]|uniref:DUF3857 domain-containing transglutaminase family protein n=1 Tax=Shewanella sp. KX20019 TaxID=2803864 RepID=UPI00192712BD|nr:DUF3857 domain-containing transglutaminase family protein [Shewanella sp. KX20019]QQX79633.1 DUF3857 domain-containing protein [Shewanella sp. KX20019]